MEGLLFETFLDDEGKNSAVKGMSVPGRGVRASVATGWSRDVNDRAVHMGPSQRRV